MDDDQLSKAKILIRQEKWAEAEKCLAILLSENSDSAYLHILLAEAKIGQNQLKQANTIIENAIQLSPDEPLAYYVKSRIFVLQNNLKEAEKFILESIRLDPEDADYFAFLANIQNARNKFKEAMESANQALELNAENVLALTIRGSALASLGKTKESIESIEAALRENPNDAYTHASYGWSLLENREHKKALEHFREALKNDPNSDYARSGMKEALKASNMIYRFFLGYGLKVSKMTKKQIGGLFIGIFITFQVLKNIIRTNQDTARLVAGCFSIFLILFLLSTWLATPLSNMLLRLNQYGSFLLTKEEKRSSNFVAGSLCVFIVSCLLCFFSNKFASIAIFGFVMMFPSSVIFTASKYRYLLWVCAFVLAVFGIFSIVEIFSTGGITMILAFVLSFILFLALTNFSRLRESNR
ncbi:MAG: tetratricopeptide repeat protein [Fibrobacter sp.]|jgi:tetratricopeptide (TPR) repeat protein|nr:tetratricopeptide repeat protein [Fibrobacter sp.]